MTTETEIETTSGELARFVARDRFAAHVGIELPAANSLFGLGKRPEWSVSDQGPRPRR